MKRFIVHQHYHHGWATNIVRAKNQPDAAYKAILLHHDWLPAEPHTWDYSRQRLKNCDGTNYEYRSVVVNAASHRVLGLGKKMYLGDYWFAVEVRFGTPNDCLICGGTKRSHYNPFEPCWRCNGSGTL